MTDTLLNLQGRNISMESESNLLKWWLEFERQDNYRITLSWVPYSEPEIQRELTRRDNVREELVSHWLEVHKIRPCPICGREFDKKGRGMAYLNAKRHVLACKGE